jgi:erythromycin esterase
VFSLLITGAADAGDFEGGWRWTQEIGAERSVFLAMDQEGERRPPFYLARLDGFKFAKSLAASPSAETIMTQARFLAWAKRSIAPLSTVTPGAPLYDLSPFGSAVGDADVVALGEAVHGAAQPLDFRNRLFEYLVEKKGFTAIAIESGAVEGRVVHDYVAGGGGDLSEVLADGISWTFDRFPQNRALIQWLREYNADLRHVRKVNFYGFDVPGSPGNPRARRGPDTALVEALTYLASVDAPASQELRTRIAPFLARIRFSWQATDDRPGYESLSKADRDALTAAIDDMINLMERREADYIARSSAIDYAWGHRAAIGARQMDRWLRLIPFDWNRSNDVNQLVFANMDARDRAQADNLRWILDQEGPSGKLFVYAHDVHLSTTPIMTDWPSLTGAREGRQQQVAGTYLRRRLDDRLITIGNIIGGGAYGGCASSVATTIAKLPNESLDGLGRELNAPRFLLDLRRAPVAVKDWLNRTLQLGPEVKGVKRHVNAARAFDMLFFVSPVSPACMETVGPR